MADGHYKERADIFGRPRPFQAKIGIAIPPGEKQSMHRRSVITARASCERGRTLTIRLGRVSASLLPNKPRGVPRVDDRRVLSSIL